jgi:hypothetical protein
MKKKIITSLSIIGTFLSFPIKVFAEELPDPKTMEVTSDVLDSFDPLQVAGSPHATTLSTPGGIITRLLEFIFPIAGLALFVMIVAGGLQILAGASNSKSMQEGQKRVTMAIVGFLILFASYWIAQILEVVFGVAIL